MPEGLGEMREGEPLFAIRHLPKLQCPLLEPQPFVSCCLNASLNIQVPDLRLWHWLLLHSSATKAIFANKHPETSIHWGCVRGRGTISKSVIWLLSSAAHRVYAVKSTMKTPALQLWARTLYRISNDGHPNTTMTYRHYTDSQAQRTSLFSTKSQGLQGARIKILMGLIYIGVRWVWTNSPKFTSSFANLLCSLPTDFSRFVITARGSMTINTAALGARASVGLIQWACSMCGWVCTYLFPLQPFC